MSNIGFGIWLSQQTNRDDWIGDLARDTQDTSDHPRGNATIAIWRSFLHSRNACQEACQALEMAWDEYCHFISPPQKPE